MNIATIFMNAAMDKRVLQQMSTSFAFSILSIVPYQFNLFFSTTLTSSNIITYMLLYQAFSHASVLVLHD